MGRLCDYEVCFSHRRRRLVCERDTEALLWNVGSDRSASKNRLETGNPWSRKSLTPHHPHSYCNALFIPGRENTNGLHPSRDPPGSLPLPRPQLWLFYLVWNSLTQRRTSTVFTTTKVSTRRLSFLTLFSLTKSLSEVDKWWLFYFIFYFLSLRDLGRGHWSRLNCQLLRCCMFKTTEFECLGPFRVQRWSLRTANVYWHNFFFGSAASAAKTLKQFTKKNKKTTTKSSTPCHARRHRPVRVKTNKMQSCRTIQLLKKKKKKKNMKALDSAAIKCRIPLVEKRGTL